MLLWELEQPTHVRDVFLSEPVVGLFSEHFRKGVVFFRTTEIRGSVSVEVFFGSEGDFYPSILKGELELARRICDVYVVCV